MILPLVLIKFKPMPIFCHCFPSNCTTYFSISIGLQSLFRIFQHLTVGVHLFFPLPGLVFISFFLPFFVSSTFIIVSLFFRFLYSAMFILFITCYPFGIVFTWPLLCYIVSSILIVCNCFLFGCHHASYIYIFICSCPSPSSILFQRDPKTPSRRSSNLRCKIPKSVLTLQMPFCIQQIPELLMQEIMYAMHTVSAPCHGTTLHPATKGVKW